MEQVQGQYWKIVAVLVGLVIAVVLLTVGLRSAAGLSDAGAPIYGSSGPAQGGASAAAQDGTAVSSPAAADDVAVSIVDFAFQPDSVEIAVGTTVTWTNTGSTPHTVTADDGAFDAGQVAPGATFSQTFDSPGTYTYHCNIHPFMTATIVVR